MFDPQGQYSTAWCAEEVVKVYPELVNYGSRTAR
jgi:hypothetical protein